MKRVIKYVVYFMSVFIFFSIAYSFYIIIGADGYTQNVILPDLRSSQWREYGGVPTKFDLTKNDLSARQLEILIRVQDPGFYNHHGIDLSTPGGGLTTISQAIVKKLYFTHFKPGLAKIRQSLIARFVVDKRISKDEQLTLFVNLMFFGAVDGSPVVGLAAAVNTYYQLPVEGLSEDQYISLIAMLVIPGTFHLLDHPEWNRERSRRIKLLIAGEYTPKGLMDQFYGPLPADVIEAGLPPASYFENSFDAGDELKGER